jgi:hypothetical protein
VEEDKSEEEIKNKITEFLFTAKLIKERRKRGEERRKRGHERRKRGEERRKRGEERRKRREERRKRGHERRKRGEERRNTKDTLQRSYCTRNVIIAFEKQVVVRVVR